MVTNICMGAILTKMKSTKRDTSNEIYYLVDIWGWKHECKQGYQWVDRKCSAEIKVIVMDFANFGMGRFNVPHEKS